MSLRSQPPSGAQHEIAYGNRHAVITQVGASLRELTFARVPVIDGFDVGHRASDGRGQVLAPWPNRLAGGSYSFDGQACQAPLNEPATQSAIHGLVRWLDWTLTRLEDSSVTLACVLRPQPGYEWPLTLEVAYRLAEDGLTVTIRAANPGTRDAPFGVGFHPYLTVGRQVDDLQLGLPARSYLPAGSEPPPSPAPLPGTGLDFSTRRAVGQTVLDTCFGDLVRDDAGKAVAVLADPAGDRLVQLWVDEGFRYLMVYTADRVGAPDRRRQSIAIEPMSCPPDAMRSGTDLVRLPPGGTWEGRWGMTAQI